MMPRVALLFLLVSLAFGQTNPWKRRDGIISPRQSGDSVSITTTLPTTADQAWSRSNSIPGTTDNGVSRVFRTRPTAESKRIVILGSSVASGQGASAYRLSWAGLLTTALTGVASPTLAGGTDGCTTGQGFTVCNVSIGGKGTADSIARFYTDVAPYLPDYVILSTGLPNDGILSDAAAAYTTYTTNTRRLIRMTEGIGAVPIIFGPYACGSYTATAYKYVKDIYEELEKYGALVINALGNVDDGTGKWVATLDSGDLLHPNDAGHAALYDSIPLGYFSGAAVQHSESAVTFGAWKLDAADATLRPLEVALDRAAGSWTFAAWMKNGGSANTKAFLCIDQQNIRMRNPSAVAEVAQANVVSTLASALNIVTDNTTWHHYAIAYQYTTNTLAFYIDGALIGSNSTWPLQGTATKFLVGGTTSSGASNAVGASFAKPLIYRAYLNTDDIKGLYLGRVIRKSLDSAMLLNHEPRLRAASLIATGAQGTVNGVWALDGASPK